MKKTAKAHGVAPVKTPAPSSPSADVQARPQPGNPLNLLLDEVLRQMGCMHAAVGGWHASQPVFVKTLYETLGSAFRPRTAQLRGPGEALTQSALARPGQVLRLRLPRPSRTSASSSAFGELFGAEQLSDVIAVAATCPRLSFRTVLYAARSAGQANFTNDERASVADIALARVEDVATTWALSVIRSPSESGEASDLCSLEPGAGDAPLLTARQRQVAALYAQGYSSKEVAEQLGVSPHTVRVHVQQAFQRLGIGSRRALRTYLRIGGRSAGGPHLGRL